MHTYIYIYICISLSLYLSLYICTYIYIYIYIEREREGKIEPACLPLACTVTLRPALKAGPYEGNGVHKGGSSIGGLANVCVSLVQL